MITKNAEEMLERSLKSVKNLVDEIVVVDDYSTDKTVEIAKKLGAKVYLHRENNLGKQRTYALKKTKSKWILVLDSDEVVPKKTADEIVNLLNGCGVNKHDAYSIPFQNHFLGKPVKYGGESYKKLILFRRRAVSIEPLSVHEKFVCKNKRVMILRNKVYHYSYRSLSQTYRKFTDYAVREAKQKYLSGERSGPAKLFLYAPHMFWARFVKDKGYKDGIFRIPLDLGFAYMEMLTYWILLISKIKDQILK